MCSSMPVCLCVHALHTSIWERARARGQAGAERIVGREGGWEGRRESLSGGERGGGASLGRM